MTKAIIIYTNDETEVLDNLKKTSINMSDVDIEDIPFTNMFVTHAYNYDDSKRKILSRLRLSHILDKLDEIAFINSTAFYHFSFCSHNESYNKIDIYLKNGELIRTFIENDDNLTLYNKISTRTKLTLVASAKCDNISFVFINNDEDTIEVNVIDNETPKFAYWDEEILCSYIDERVGVRFQTATFKYSIDYTVFLKKKLIPKLIGYIKLRDKKEVK